MSYGGITQSSLDEMSKNLMRGLVTKDPSLADLVSFIPDQLSFVLNNMQWGDPDLAEQQIKFLKEKNYNINNLDKRQLEIHKLARQILDQGTTSKWTGEGLGSPSQNARAIADTLASVGITDIRQFGQLPDGRYGNKTTGQAINPNYTRAGGNIWSGTFIGENSTGFGVEFAPDGTPYFYTQEGASTSDFGKIAPIISLGLTFFAPGIGGAIGSALTGAAATTVASQVIGAAVVQGVLAEAQGGDFLDGAIRGAVTAGVAPVVANTVGTTVADIMADSAVKNVVANAVASSASSAVTAALTGGDVEQAALTGALGGAGGSIGRELGTAAELGTTPFSQQTQMLAGQEQGLATGGSAGSQLGQALGVIGAGADPSQSLTNALINFYQEQVRATPDTGSSGVVSPAVPDQTAQAKEEELLVPGAENVAQMVLAPQGQTVAGQPEFTPDFVAAMPQMQPRENEEAGPVVSDTFDSGETFFYRDIKATLPDGTSRYYRITYDPSHQYPFSYSGSYGENQLFESFNRPEFNVDAQVGDTASAGVTTPESVAPAEAPPSFVPEQVNILDLIAADRGVAAPETLFTPPTESTFTPVPEVSEPVSGGQTDVSGAPVVTTPEVLTEITPPSTQEIPIPDQISQELGGVQEGVAGVIPSPDQELIDLITQPDIPVAQSPEVVITAPGQEPIPGIQEGVPETIPEDLGIQEGVAGTIPNLDQEILDLVTQPPVTEQNLALNVLGEPLTPEAVDITPVPEENLALDVLGQPLTPEAIDIEPIPQDPLLGLSSPAVGEGEQEAIDYQALEGLSDPSVGLGEEAAIDQANLDALGDLSSAEVGQGEQEAIDYQALEELSSAEVGEGEQEAINRQALEELSSAEVGEGEQEAINRQALEELSSAEVGEGEQQAIDRQAQDFYLEPTPYIRDFYLSTGRRKDFGPTVTTLGQALSAPFFPSSPTSSLTSYRGAGEIESQSTGKPRRNVWNEASLRLKDALGL